MSDERFLSDDVEALLRSEAMWGEPSPDVERRVMEGFTGAAPPQRGSRMWLLGVAAAAFVLIGVGVVLSRSPSPDWQVALAAPPESTITGLVQGWNEPTGTRVVLEIDNLDPATTGTFYEVWWVDLETGGAVSSGSFLEEDSIEMWMGIRRSEFPKMLITVENSDGDPSPSDAVIAWSDD